MRIAFITFEYPPFIIGGAGIYAINITSKLSELGHQVIVFTPKINNLEEKCNINNLEIRRIRINERLPFKALQFWLRLPKAVKKTENENRFDIIHFNGISYWFLKKRLSKAPHVLTVHHLVKDAIRSNNPSLISRIRDIGGENGFFVPYVEKRCIKYADKFIAVSNFTKKRIIETYKVPSDKIEVVYNGIDLSEYENLPKRGEFKRKYKIKFEIGNYKKTAKYIKKLYNNPELSIKLREYGFEKFKKEFNKEEYYKKLMEIYRK